MERDPKIPYNCEADWNASIGGDKVVSGNVVYTDVNDPDTYMIDIDGDEVGDYKVVWEDIDGDGKLEGGVDRDGDGHIDDVDQDGRYMTVVPSTNVEDRYHKDPSDPTTTSAHVGKDVVLLHTDTNGDGKVDDNEWKQMEWPSSGPDIVVWGNADYDGATKGYQKPYDRYVVVDNFEFIDINKNGKYDDTVDYPIVWQDLDGTVYTNRANGTQFTTVEGIADINRNGKVDAGDRVDNDGKDYEGNLDDATHNPNHLDVIMLDYTGDHFAETPLSKKVPVPIDLGTEIRFTADVDAWISNVNGVKPIGN